METAMTIFFFKFSSTLFSMHTHTQHGSFEKKQSGNNDSVWERHWWETLLIKHNEICIHHSFSTRKSYMKIYVHCVFLWHNPNSNVLNLIWYEFLLVFPRTIASLSPLSSSSPDIPTTIVRFMRQCTPNKHSPASLDWCALPLFMCNIKLFYSLDFPHVSQPNDPLVYAQYLLNIDANESNKIGMNASTTFQLLSYGNAKGICFSFLFKILLNMPQIIGNDWICGFYNISKQFTFSSIDFGFLWFSFLLGYNELVAALQHLQGQLNKHGLASLAGRVTNVQGLLLGPVVARALHIRSAVLQRRRPRTQNAIRSDAKALAKEVSVYMLFIFFASSLHFIDS